MIATIELWPERIDKLIIQRDSEDPNRGMETEKYWCGGHVDLKKSKKVFTKDIPCLFLVTVVATINQNKVVPALMPRLIPLNDNTQSIFLYSCLIYLVSDSTSESLIYTASSDYLRIMFVIVILLSESVNRASTSL